MADTGAPHSIPYPIASDAPAGHTQMQSLATQVATRLGFVGKSIVATAEARTNSAYGLLTTPDRVQNVVLPTDGLIEIHFQALWKYSIVAPTPRAAIFIGSNQLKVQAAGVGGANGPVTQAAVLNSTNATYALLATSPMGLVSVNAAGASDNSSDVTTGQAVGAAVTSAGSYYGATELGGTVFDLVTASDSGGGGGSDAQMLGGPLRVFAAAGTYDISVQFKIAASSVTVKERKLWVRVLPF